MYEASENDRDKSMKSRNFCLPCRTGVTWNWVVARSSLLQRYSHAPQYDEVGWGTSLRHQPSSLALRKVSIFLLGGQMDGTQSEKAWMEQRECTKRNTVQVNEPSHLDWQFQNNQGTMFLRKLTISFRLILSPVLLESLLISYLLESWNLTKYVFRESSF